MSIASEISRLSSNISDSLDAVAAKGVTVPSDSNSDDLPGLIALIEQSSGGDSGGTIYQDTDGYLHLSEDNKNVISIVDTLDTAGGTIRTITSKVDSGGSYSVDDFAMRLISGDINLTSATKIIEYTFASSAITSLMSETVTEIRSNACSDCSQLSAVELPNCVNGRAANQIFARCTNLVTVKIPKLNNLWSNAFENCRSLQNVVFPAVVRLNSNVFLNCTNLISADFSANINIANGGNFQGCTSLSVLVLRSSSICPLGNISSFTNSPFASGGAGGTLYVPSALISSYQSATNWSTILGYTNNQILPIEGSIYETQYVDGTPIT